MKKTIGCKCPNKILDLAGNISCPGCGRRFGNNNPTLRDQFAMATLPALVGRAATTNMEDWQEVAPVAYALADLMLIQRGKK